MTNILDRAWPDKKKTEAKPIAILKCRLEGHSDLVWGIDFSPDGKMLASGSHDQTIRLWEIATGKLITTIEGPSVHFYCVDFSQDGKTLASGSHDKTICLWEVSTGKHLATLVGHNNSIFDISFSPDGETLASCSFDNTIRLWEVSTGKNLATLEGHSKYVLSLSFSMDGKMLASGSSDRTIRLWEVSTGKNLATLEGHSSVVQCVSFSPDGKTFASCSFDNTIRFWEASTGKHLATLEGHNSCVYDISFSPDGKILASGSADSTIRFWEVSTGKHLTTLEDCSGAVSDVKFSPDGKMLACGNTNNIILWEIAEEPIGGTVESNVHYTNAKVVLVGDSGVGKTGLGLVLNGEEFVPTESSHGRHVWSFDSQEVELDGGRKETREILLWDLAGQPGYRIIHQLHLDEVAVALVVFDARSETDPFGGVLHWNRALNLAQRIQGKSTVPLRKILVAARTDRGGVSVSPERIYTMMRNMGFTEYYETSAKEGWGIKELIEKIHDEIAWDQIPKVTSTKLFQEIKTFLIKEKEEERLLATVDDLYRTFMKTRKNKKEDLNAEFKTCIGRVESQGLIRRLNFGGFVLLQPELLDSYASSIVNEARNEPEGMGCIHEEQARAGDFYIPEGDRLRDKDQERLLLIATVEDLLRHEIALREDTDHGPQLVFPSQFTRENPELPNPEGSAVIFGFEGPVLNIYTTLVVRLTHSGVFKMDEMWRNAALFTCIGTGGYGICLRQLEDGKGELTLFFKPGAKEEICFQFEEYVKSHLMRKALPETVKRRRIFTCPESDCGETITDKQAQRRRERGFKTLNCPVCDTEINLLDREERLAKVPPSVVPEMDYTADKQRDREAAALILQGKIETGDFDVFLAHNNKDKPQVEAINEELKKRGLYPWIDNEQIPPGRWFQDVIQKAIPNVKSAAIFIGPEGLGKWQTIELRSFISQCVERKLPVIPVLLPGIEDIPQDLIFLEELSRISFMEKVDELEALDNLEWGIKGEKPQRP